ncbi:hypothetical protein ANTQUA_LOCUS2239 [Anthophora quadrimaculata]
MKRSEAITRSCNDVAEQILQSVCMYVYLNTENVEGCLMVTYHFVYNQNNGTIFQGIFHLQKLKKIFKDGVKCAPNIKNAAKLLGSARNALWHYIFQNVLKSTIH